MLSFVPSFPAVTGHSNYPFFRVTGVEVGISRRLQRLFPVGQGELQQAITALLPPQLLQKIQKRKLVRSAEEDEQLSGRLFKML